ncbi:MAG: 50S ribosomal protein L29 [Elusimicrobia bacterium]|nr:50S ribosomal protein L29 [Elusimicrobiota bacterium]
MAKEKKIDYKQASEGELQQRLQKSQEELFKLRFRAASAPLKNTMSIRKVRREVARVHTYMSQRRNNP